MNNFLGIVTLLFILVTAIIIGMKFKNIKSILWNIVLLIASGVSFGFGNSLSEVWETLLCNIIIGASLLIAAIHAYNKLFTSGKVYESIGESKKPRMFGNGYWR